MVAKEVTSTGYNGPVFDTRAQALKYVKDNGLELKRKSRIW